MCAMDSLIGLFEEGMLHHGDLTKTLQAMYVARAEMGSEIRDRYFEHMKEIWK